LPGDLQLIIKNAAKQVRMNMANWSTDWEPL